jgi:hypothetical protein
MRGWEDNIKIDLRRTGWEFVGWMYLAQDGDQLQAVVNMVMIRFHKRQRIS